MVWYGRVWVCCCGVEVREGCGREGSKEAHAERLRDGYRYSFLLSSALSVVVIEMRVLQLTVQHTRQ